MQVFISDVHLTDGSSGQTINHGAFKVFRDNLIDLVTAVKDKSTVTELKIVLLGDIFDIIRSKRWLDAGVTVRPWDDAGPVQKQIVLDILTGILDNDENKKSLECLLGIRTFAADQGINFQVQYIIGNHDWLINRYPESREKAAIQIGMPPGDPGPFPTELFDSAYLTFARHGDIYDEFNYMGSRDRSSIGDAIVIELLNKYPRVADDELRKMVDSGEITAKERDRLITELKELDNIRPLLDAPSWVLRVSSRTTSDAARRVIEDAWSKCVDDFFKVPFIKNMDIPFWPDNIDMLQVALQLSSHTSKWALEKIVELKNRFTPGGVVDNYSKRAYAEAKARSGEACYVLYGHTHDHLIVPMDQVPLSDGDTLDKIYFNTGTWRQTWNKVAFDNVNREFIGWKVLTYIAFYNKKENHDYGFEVWTGALG